MAVGSARDEGLERMARQARQHLTEEILPFWWSHGIDENRGGFYTCFDNRGRPRSTDKYTWSQGRFVAMLGRLVRAADQGLIEGDRSSWVTWAVRGAEFLRTHALRDDGTVHYVVDADGRPPLTSAGDPPRSLYADCFVAMGFAEVAAMTGDADWMVLAETLARAAEDATREDPPPTAPYLMPPGSTAFGPRMIMLNVYLDLARAGQELGRAVPVAALEQAATRTIDMARGDGLFDELRFADESLGDTLLARHRTPGHALEGLWMLAESRRYGLAPDLDDLGQRAVALSVSAWDTDQGGLFRYVDSAGGQPRGRLLHTEYEQLVQRTWSTKLWWVHSEACYTLALLGHLTGDGRVRDWRDRVWDYTTGTFPAGDQGEEWIQIRRRDGSPLDEVVALPLKDPYHLTRNLLQIVELGSAADR